MGGNCIPDHRPVLLKDLEVDYGPTPFRFFHSWLDMEGFRDLVTDTWNNDGINEVNGLVSFKKKIQNLKCVIREWVTSKRSESNKSKKEHQMRLFSINVKIDQGRALQEDFCQRRDSIKILGDIDRLVTKDIAQKAKVKWAIEGDENTSFYHNMLKKKRRQLAIKGIFKNGNWIEDPHDVKAEFFMHFSSRFQHSKGIPPSLDGDMPNHISSGQSDYPENPFTRDEIKRAVWDCGGDRAPGPDGFTFKFITTFWDVIEAGSLIPKITNAKFVTDFHPISLIGCQYKIVGKLLANRLSTVIGGCVSSEQSAFIKGRNILDGPLVLNEIMAWHRKRKKDLMVFKVDFEKAFDSLRWDFLDLVMVKLGFGTKWRKWIFGCLQMARTSVLVNGSPTCEFEIYKGLRQGDPLSHFLFILAMEGLHVLTCKAELVSLFKGVSFGHHNMRISHLIYADDMIFLGEWSRVGVSNEEVSNLAKIIGCGAAKFPMKYLGVPVGGNMARCSNWNAIIHKFSSKLSLWKVRLLSVGGRLSLIKSVLGSLPTYYMSIYMMPATVQKKLKATRNKFFIGGDLDEKKMTWLRWKKCLASKELGGLGIGSIYGLNIGLLFKWVW
ncbi:putative RNA-directed DNA polymerase, eukaryota, reverse transcriptase zinc-binding domain protein, partial [Tanacetum coccineum]